MLRTTALALASVLLVVLPGDAASPAVDNAAPHLARITFYHLNEQPDNDARQRRITVKLLSGKRTYAWASNKTLINGVVRLNKKNGGHLISYRSRLFWEEMDTEKYPYGKCCRGDAVVPYRTVAADPQTYPYGTRLYIPMFDQLTMPDGSVHDGYFVVVDTGGKIRGHHLDLAVRSDADYRELARKIPWQRYKSGEALWVRVVEPETAQR